MHYRGVFASPAAVAASSDAPDTGYFFPALAFAAFAPPRGKTGPPFAPCLNGKPMHGFHRLEVCGRAMAPRFLLRNGQAVRQINTRRQTQVVDCWAWNAGDLTSI
jgi:hypothetical protein